jgi:hypothetical protein
LEEVIDVALAEMARTTDGGGGNGGDPILARLYELLVRTSDGELRDPHGTKEWSEWVTASAMEHWLKGDPLVDLLETFGESKGFRPDEKYPGYDHVYSLRRHLVELASDFQRAVVTWLKQREDVVEIGGHGRVSQSLDHARRTVAAMRARRSIIVGPVLRNPDERTYGSPSMLIRSDVMARLFPVVRSLEAPGSVEVPAPGLGRQPWHYRVVDIRLSRGPLSKAIPEGTRLAYRVHNDVHNRAVGRLQGYEPRVSYLLGRGSLDSCLTPVDHGAAELGRLACEAAAWVRRLRREGAGWEALPEPTVPELRPNMKVDDPIGWSRARREIAERLDEITLLPWCAVEERAAAFRAGVTRWDDPRLSAAVLGLGGVIGRRVDAILRANRVGGSQVMVPWPVPLGPEWKAPAPLEVFVSAQTCDDPAVEFPAVELARPMRTVVISWVVADGEGGSLVARDLSDAAEADLLGRFGQVVRELAARRGVAEDGVRLIQWSAGLPASVEFERLDMRTGLFEAVPIGVRGALGSGLREVAEAMRRAGLIEVEFPDRPADGQEAAAAILEAGKQAKACGVGLDEVELMRKVRRYGEARCAATAEIRRCLRHELPPPGIVSSIRGR